MDPGDSERSSSAGATLATNLSPRLRDLLKRYGVALALASVTVIIHVSGTVGAVLPADTLITPERSDPPR